MKRSSVLSLFSLLLVSFVLASCGSGPGAPGSSGSEDTGIRIATAKILCCPPDPQCVTCTCEPCRDIDVNLPDGQLLSRTVVTLSIEALKLNPGSPFDPFPASIEQCTITYLKAIEDPASPTIESLNIFPNCTIASGSNICTVTLIDAERKRRFWNARLGGINSPAEYPTHYVAKYNCTYINNFNNKGTFQTEFDFWLADF